MDLQMNIGAPIYLYLPQVSRVLQIIQIPSDPHPFVGFDESERYVLMGYMAHHYRTISPIYCPAYASGTPVAILSIIGVLAVPHMENTVFYTVYEKLFGDGDFLRAVETQFCRPNVIGTASLVWFVSELNNTIRFNPAPFPFGFPPPAAIEPAPLLQPVFHEPTMLEQFASVSLPPSVGPVWSVDNDDEFDYEGLITTASLGYYAEDPQIFPPETYANLFEELTPTSQTVTHQALMWKGSDDAIDGDYRRAIKVAIGQSVWKRPMYLTKCLYLGSQWVGLGNPFNPSEREDRKLLTNCFLEAISLDHTTLQELVDVPLTVHTETGNSTIKWDTIRLTFSGYVESRLSDLRKIVRGCILSDTGFSGNTGKERDARVKELFELLVSIDEEHVERAILQIIKQHMFKELLWATMLQTSSALAEGSRKGRIADLFPEEFRDKNMTLSIRVVGTLLTIIYHTLHRWRPAKTPGRKPVVMYRVLVATLTHMYDNPDQFREFHDTLRGMLHLRAQNVLPMNPKALCPRTSTNEKRPRILSDVEPIVQADEDLPGLPYAVFTSIRSERVQESADDSCFDDAI